MHTRNQAVAVASAANVIDRGEGAWPGTPCLLQMNGTGTERKGKELKGASDMASTYSTLILGTYIPGTVVTLIHLIHRIIFRDRIDEMVPDARKTNAQFMREGEPGRVVS